MAKGRHIFLKKDEMGGFNYNREFRCQANMILLITQCSEIDEIIIIVAL